MQETKTDKALDELKKITSINVKVIRNGIETVISSNEVVVGYIIFLEEGDSVPADGEEIYAQSFGVNESSLTVESQVVYKKDKRRYRKSF